MKTKLCFLVFLVTNIVISQDTTINSAQSSSPSPPTSIGENGFNFEITPTFENTEFSEIGSGFFKEKFIMVSSKKIGGLSKIDHKTGEAYKDLYCLDINAEDGLISRPLSYSRILNTHFSEDQITFSKNENTVYYTRSSHENSLEFKLYKADLEENSNGNWINELALSVNQPNVSIETPFTNRAGDKLFFSANYPDSHGGFDLYVSDINPDGTLGTPKNLGNIINTSKDEKYPALSMEEKYLFFASKGHNNLGGYDIFRSKISNSGIKQPRNLGTTINTPKDDIAFFLATKEQGYVSSNKSGGIGSYDVYIVTNHDVLQSLKGSVSDLETNIKLPNAELILFDDDGVEIARTLSNEVGAFEFTVTPFEEYTISTSKSGFVTSTEPFVANHKEDKYKYAKEVKLQPTVPVIVDSKIVLENIYFDFNKWNIKEESFVTLNKVVKILNNNPEMKLDIQGHTDNRGSASYNLLLSKRRAASTVKYLIEHDIAANRLKSEGFGETKPLINCNTNCSEEEHHTNRRIEFLIVK
ncbi:OmpA family protein [Tamlana sp. 2_MG-2023]|uniref:OmpA family protein n=1 Tax=unclassified Tamlana TaxID=2614803 RepID=UPI0026E26191|nr:MULTISPECIES: OmpA family protein [unclassified Tamlana]MDO6761000.1 OmpA family protein [Tamlana sp. 2_MG-2023]MDO6791667.1 OmpA family protein [Tamlana sp. 1_MG-2023]